MSSSPHHHQGVGDTGNIQYEHQPPSAVADRYIEPFTKQQPLVDTADSVDEPESNDRGIGESPTHASYVPRPDSPLEPMSVAAAQAAGTSQSSAYFKERVTELAMKRDGENVVEGYEKEEINDAEAQSKHEVPTPITMKNDQVSGTHTHANSDSVSASKVPPLVQSPAKRRRLSLAGERISVAPGPGDASENTGTATVTGSHPPSGKRAACAESLTRSLVLIEGVEEISESQRYGIAKKIEASLFALHPSMGHDYTNAARDISYNLAHNRSVAVRVLDGRIDTDRLAHMDWKSLADAALKAERAEEAHRDLIDHLTPVETTAGIMPNTMTTAK